MNVFSRSGIVLLICAIIVAGLGGAGVVAEGAALIASLGLSAFGTLSLYLGHDHDTSTPTPSEPYGVGPGPEPSRDETTEKVSLDLKPQTIDYEEAVTHNGEETLSENVPYRNVLLREENQIESDAALFFIDDDVQREGLPDDLEDLHLIGTVRAGEIREWMYSHPHTRRNGS